MRLYRSYMNDYDLSNPLELFWGVFVFAFGRRFFIGFRYPWAPRRPRYRFWGWLAYKYLGVPYAHFNS